MHSMTWMAAAIALAVSGTAMAGDPAPAPAPDAPAPAAPAPAPTPAPAAPAPAPTPAPAAPAPAPAPAPPAPAAHELPFKISGKTFVDFSYAQNADHGANTKAQTLGLDVKRFYLGIDYTLNQMISATFLTDIGDLQGKFDVFVKKAFIQAKLSPALVLRAGSADTPWIPYAEDRYDHRYVENTIIDRVHDGNSADWGLHALGEVADGRVGYQVSIVNGHGYANPTRAKWPSLEARLDTTVAGHLHAALGASVSTLGATSSVPHTGTRFDALVAWDDARVHAGVEGFLASNYTADQISGVAPEDTARGVSVFAAYRFVPALGAFGRFDFVQPVADTDPDVKDTYLNVGLEYAPWKFLKLALVYKHETVEAGATGFVFSTTNGKIGSMTPGSSGTYQEVGLFAQLVL